MRWLIAPQDRARGQQRADVGAGLRWSALLMLAGFALAPAASAQAYKCTDAAGRTAFSDTPCASVNAATSADTIAAMCAPHEGSPPTDATIQALPTRQRDAVNAALRGVISGMARDPAAQGALKRLTLHLDGARNAIICAPRPRAQSPGATATTPYVAMRVEPNGRTETLQPGTPPQVSNDANEPITVAGRCASLITSCVRAKTPGAGALDACVEQQPACPAGRLDPALSCCPQACKEAYRRARAGGIDAETAVIKVIFGDDAGAASCVPGMPRRG